MNFKTISQIINESEATDLFKCYLAIRRESGHRWWSYKGFAGNKYFIQVTENNIDEIDVDASLPILNYSNLITEKLIEKGCKLENVYNKPKDIDKSGSKKKFHKLVGEDENLPKTVYTKSDALKLGFPIIAKPTSGHSGIGIQVIKDKEEFDKADHSKFDLYSEFIDKKNEHRFFNFNGKPIVWLERKPMNDKAKSGDGENDEEMNFQYIKHDHNKTPEKYKKVIEKFCKIMKDFPFICFDIMEDKSGKIYIIESNSQPGVPFDSTVQIYKSIFEDFYGRPVNKKTEEILDKYSKELDERTLKKDSKRFKIEL